MDRMDVGHDPRDRISGLRSLEVCTLRAVLVGVGSTYRDMATVVAPVPLPVCSTGARRGYGIS